ncbi:hypothetical protein [Corallococcus macrosporus]|uniref:Uncharacterized protein n=1 Tax=Myxococcus fulvus (strain ATCC BAA-855 / HW-1) TaxID=483219 RepID=F8CDY2_MYXFH|nr:hypothetical protein [Corallococcus macrosporus]AEI62341.1 hypothetical protein LILAB_02070 [Corallococcus macrosporus]
MSNASSLMRTAQLNRDALLAALRQDLSSTRRIGVVMALVGAALMLYGWPQLDLLMDAGREELTEFVSFLGWGAILLIGGLLVFWRGSRHTRRLIRSVKADERAPMLMTVLREEVPTDDDERVRFVATLYNVKERRVALRDVHLRTGDTPMAYPYDDGVTKVPVEVYGRPGEGPIVIDAAGPSCSPPT